MAALKRTETVGGLPHLETPIAYSDASALAAAVRTQHPSIVYLTAGLSGEAQEIGEAMKGLDVLTVAAEPTCGRARRDRRLRPRIESTEDRREPQTGQSPERATFERATAVGQHHGRLMSPRAALSSLAVFVAGLVPRAVLALPPAAGVAQLAEPGPGASAPAAPAPAGAAASDSSDADLAAALNEQVLAGASRVVESVETAPVTATTIRAEDLSKYGIRTLAEALRFLAVGVFTWDGATGLSESSGARGVGINADSNTHFLFVIDGNISSRSSGDLTSWAYGLPLEMIDTIEVILGPGSVLYGGNAMLGVINITTKPARHMLGLRLFAEYGVSPSTNARGRLKSFDPSTLGTSPRISASLGHEFSFAGLNAELTGQVEWARQTMAEADIPLQTPVPASVPGYGAVPQFGGALRDMVVDGNAGGYARLRLGRLVLDGQFGSGAVPLSGAAAGVVFPEPSFERSWVITTARFDARYAFDLSARLSGFVRMYLSSELATSDRLGEIGAANTCPPGGTFGSRCEVTNEFTARHQGTEVQVLWNIGGDGQWQLLAGVDGRLRQSGNLNRVYDSATLKEFAPTGGFDARGVTTGVYSQLRAQPWTWLGINAGARYDWDHDEATGLTGAPTQNPVLFSTLPTTEDSALSPRAGLVLSPTETTTVHGAVSRAFRPPSPVQRYARTAVVEASPNLAPETVTSGEIGLKQKFGAHRALLTLFLSRWEGLIGLGDGSAVGKFRFQDTGTIDNYGTNIGTEGSFLLQRLQYAASFTWGYARATPKPPDLSKLNPALAGIVRSAAATSNDTIELTGSPELSGNARASYDLQGGRPTVALATSIYGPRLTSFAYSSTLLLPPSPGTPYPVFGYNWRSNIDPKHTDPRVELRLTLTGPFPHVAAVRYRLMGTYLFTPALEPVAFGVQPGATVPTVANVPGLVSAPRATGQLWPVTVMTIMAGLEIDVDP